MIKERLNIDTALESGKTGQFDVIADGETIAFRGGNWFTRRLGAGWPDLEVVVDALKKRLDGRAASG
jgi:hypothetical protein